MRQLHLTLPGEPVAWARARRNGDRYFTAATQRAAMDAMIISARAALRGQQPLQGPLKLTARYVFDWPKIYSQRRRQMAGAQWKTTKPDLDNLTKLIGDALNGVAYADDNQICAHDAIKQFGQSPATYITLEELADVQA